MTKVNRWVDELPVNSAARQLLIASKNAHSLEGSVDRGWQALSVALGSATAVVTLTTKATASVATKTATVTSATAAAKTTAIVAGTVATKAAIGSLGGLLGVKSLVIGIAVGMGALGTRRLIEQVPARDVAPPLAATIPSGLPVVPSVSYAVDNARRGGAPAVSATAPAVSASALTLTETNVAVTSPAVEPSAARASRGSVLTKQAREIARVKRLIDAGGSVEAIARLEASTRNDSYSALSEERDALYVEALERAGRKTLAKSKATRFLSRYPKSPHVERMREIVRAK